MDNLKELIKDNEKIAIKLSGNSMYPTLSNGDTVIVKRVDFNEIKVGDIAVFKTTGNKYIVHRMIGKQDKGIITKPDFSLFRPDNKLVLAQDIVGIVATVYRKGKLINAINKNRISKLYYLVILTLTQNNVTRAIIDYLKKSYFIKGVYRYIRRLKIASMRS